MPWNSVTTLIDRLHALEGYAQHKDTCRLAPRIIWSSRPKVCTCGLADLLTPASAEEPEKP